MAGIHKRSDKVFQQVPIVPHNESMSDDYGAVYAMTQQKVREHWVAVENVNIAREKLASCYSEYGVNHAVVCKDLAKNYMELIQSPTFQSHTAPQPE